MFSTQMVFPCNQHFAFFVARKTHLGNMLQTSGWDKNLNGVLLVPVPLVHLFNSPFALNFTNWSFWPFGIICAPISVSILILSSASPRSLIYLWFWAPNYRNHPLAETPVLDLDPETSFPTSNTLFLPTLPLTCSMVMVSGSYVTCRWYF